MRLLNAVLSLSHKLGAQLQSHEENGRNSISLNIFLHYDTGRYTLSADEAVQVNCGGAAAPFSLPTFVKKKTTFFSLSVFVLMPAVPTSSHKASQI